MSSAQLEHFRLGWLGGSLAALLLCCSPARADAIADWRAIAATAVSASGLDNEGERSRVLSIVNAAMRQAVRTTAPASLGAAGEAAAAAAAHYVLCQLYPEQRVRFTLALVRSLEAIPDGAEKVVGQVTGTNVGKDVYAALGSDPATTLAAEPSR